ncbi:Spirocyclase AveC-like protein [compost metagenome]
MKMERLIDRVPARRLVLGPVLVWSALGLLFTCFSLAVFGAWIFSPEFAPLALSEADAMPRERLLMLRGLEVISVLVALAVLYVYLLRPWLKTGRAPLEGLLLIGALITYVLDTTINFSDYHMAWNKHSFNMGTWGGFFPGHTGPTQYAEAWLWGPPMYMYFGVALASIQLLSFRLVRPRLGRAAALLIAFAAAFLFDLVAEVAIIRFSEAYAWPYAVGSLSLWAGSQFQFPLYESLLVAIYASLYSWLMYSARRDGLSFIERGLPALPERARPAARLFAATGFAALCTSMYFGGFYAFSQFADTRVEMPGYLMYSDEGWQPARP